MRKVIRDGLVAVIIGDEYKCGWFTEHKIIDLLYDPHVVEFIEANHDFSKSLEPAYRLEEYLDDKYGERPYYGDVTELKLEWIPKDTSFIVREIYGWETIIVTDGEYNE